MIEDLIKSKVQEKAEEIKNKLENEINEIVISDIKLVVNKQIEIKNQ
jgi:hypothetical protein